MRVRAFCTLAVLLSTAAWSSTAEARECANPLVGTCINSDTYWPNPGPMRFATVAGTETVARGQVGFGLVATYLSRPVVVRVASPGPGGSDQFVVDDQVNGNFLFAYGVTERLQLDFALPITFVETGAGTSPITGGENLRDTAVRDVRFGFAYALVPRVRLDPETAAKEGGPGRSWSLTARFGATAPAGDRPDFAGDRSVVYTPSLAADYRVWRVFFGLELGARVRKTTEFAGARVGTQLVTGLGAGFDILDRERLSAMLEARAYPTFAEQHDTAQSATGISSQPNGKSIMPAEWMLTARTAPFLGGDFAFFAGGGGPIPTSSDAPITSPRFRFILGAVYAPFDRDSDGDGVIDRNDQCPNTPGPRRGERPGCPEPQPDKVSTSEPSTEPANRTKAQ